MKHSICINHQLQRTCRLAPRRYMAVILTLASIKDLSYAACDAMIRT